MHFRLSPRVARHTFVVWSHLMVALGGMATVGAASGFDDAHRIWTAQGDQPGAGFGSAVASAGDVNGDSFPDLLVGARHYDGVAGADCGKVFLYYGSAAGPSPTAGWSAEGELTSSYFGAAVASAGDVNGDGFGDVVVGAPGFSDPNYYPFRYGGRIYVYLGSAAGLSASPVLVADGQPYDLGFTEGLGSSLTAGDFNGDGFSDVMAGQYARYVGRGRVFYGSAAGPSVDHAWTVSVIYPEDQYLGNSIAAGDFNGDGYDDALLTILPQDGGVARATGYLGSATGLPPIPDWPEPPPTPAFSFPYWANVSTVGDLDRDGYDDLLVLVSPNDLWQTNIPYHALYRGSPFGPIPGVELGPVFGVPGRITPVGDLDRDGFRDAVAQDGSTFFFYFGSTTGYRPMSDGMGTLEGVVGAAGDVNGDGFDDLVVGSAGAERVDVYRGGNDWSFSATADVSVAKTSFPEIPGFQITIANSGPDAVRMRLVDRVPASLAGSGWACLYSGWVGVADRCLNDGLAGVGNLDRLVTIMPGGSLTYEIVAPPSSLTITNTARLVLPDWVSDPNTSNNEATAVLGTAQESLFADGFESGSVAAWSSHRGGGLRVTPAAAIDGAYGLVVTAPGRGVATVQDDTPANEVGYHLRFRFDPNGFGLARTARPFPGRTYRAVLLSAHSTVSASPRFEIRLTSTRGRLFLTALAATDSEELRELATLPIADTAHVVEAAWRRASGPSASDGLLQFQVDGAQAGGQPNLDNYAGGGIDQVELGLTVVGGPPPSGPSRTVLLDSFESWRLP